MDEPQKAVTESNPAKARLRRRGIYLLPNAITISSLFCGFYAIVMSLNLEFKQATVAIFISMILDSMDGRVARLTRTQSEFGAQLDSLADMVAFGAAPALVVYEWSLKGMGRIGWVSAFVFCACAALRLARFNTNIKVVDKRFFQGLPSPAAAALVAGFIWLMDDIGFAGSDFYWTSWILTLYAGLTMVSNVPVLQFQGNGHPQIRTVHRRHSRRPDFRHDFFRSAQSAFRIVRHLWRFRLCRLSLAQAEGKTGQHRPDGRRPPRVRWEKHVNL